MNGLKTFILAAVVAVLGTAQTFNWTDVVSGQTAGVILIVIGGAIAVIRTLTKGPDAVSAAVAPKA